MMAICAPASGFFSLGPRSRVAMTSESVATPDLAVGRTGYRAAARSQASSPSSRPKRRDLLATASVTHEPGREAARGAQRGPCSGGPA